MGDLVGDRRRELANGGQPFDTRQFGLGRPQFSRAFSGTLFELFVELADLLLGILQCGGLDYFPVAATLAIAH